MSDREKAINVLKTLPDDISLKDILDTLCNIFDLKDRLDNINEEEAISSEDLKKEIGKLIYINNFVNHIKIG